MHYSHRLRETQVYAVVGAFVFASLFLVGAGLVVFSWEEQLFAERYSVSTAFREGYGLRRGRPVMILGIPVGDVSGVEFTDDNRAKVTLRILESFREKIREGSVARVVKSGGFMGETQIEVTAGDPSQPRVPDGGRVPGEDPYTLTELMADTKPVIDSVKAALLRIDQVTADFHAAVRTGKDTLENVHRASAEFPRVLQDLHGTTASFRRTADGVARDVPAITASALESAQNVRIATGDLRTLVQGELVPLVRAARDTMRDVDEVVTGARRTFPISVFATRGRAPEAEEPVELPPSPLRTEDIDGK